MPVVVGVAASVDVADFVCADAVAVCSDGRASVLACVAVGGEPLVLAAAPSVRLEAV
ncbi:MAG: hypothetical protein WBV85_09700 [Solirubrobacteraceae bacterium]